MIEHNEIDRFEVEDEAGERHVVVVKIGIIHYRTMSQTRIVKDKKPTYWLNGEEQLVELDAETFTIPERNILVRKI